jgi:DUF2939 family protein
MKKLSVFGIFAALVAFFIVWPGWVAYEAYTAVQAKDAKALERRIDFPSVRTSLRAAVADKLTELYVPPQTLPSSPVLAERLKREAVQRLVGGALEDLVTADSLILLISEGGPLKDSVERMLRDQIGRGSAPKRVGPVTTLAPGQAARKSGAAMPAAPARGPVVRTVSSEEPKSGSESESAAEPGYGLGNVKSFSVLGPFRYEIGLAKSRTASSADVLAELSFTGLGWKITAIKPKL